MLFPKVPKPLNHDFGAVLYFYTEDGITICRADGTDRFETPIDDTYRIRFSKSADSFAWLEEVPWETSRLSTASSPPEDPEDETEPGYYLTVTESGSNHSTRMTEELHLVDLAWSHDDREIWFTAGKEWPHQLYKLEITDGRIAKITTGESPKPSPDGTKVAYLGVCPKTERLVGTVLDVETGVSQPAVNTSMLYGWSPDSTRLAFTEFSRSTFLKTGCQSPELFTYSLEGGVTRQIAPDAEAVYSPTWTDDGSQLVFQHSPHHLPTAVDTPSRIAIADAEGGPLRELTDGPRDGSPQCHPTRPLFAYDQGWEGEVYVQSLVTGEHHCLGQGREPHWLA